MAIQNLDAYRKHPLFVQNPDLVRVLEVFSGISNYPRPSREENAVRFHLIGIAEKQGWKIERDDTGNVVFHVPATSGNEDVMPVVMQGHMDIVTFPDDSHLPRQAEIIDKGNDGDEKGLWMQNVGQK